MSKPVSSDHSLPLSSRLVLARRSTTELHDFPIVAIGASAGGLDACRSLVSTLRRDGRMAFILVQHFDPSHKSMMVDLLKDHTPLTITQAADGMLIERDTIYVIPSGTYLACVNGHLQLSTPPEPHRTRLPVDFLLSSLSVDCETRAACIILSGTGADGSEGIKAIKHCGGLVIAQDPAEAVYAGMPRSAIATGLVDLVLPIAKMSEALQVFAQERIADAASGKQDEGLMTDDSLAVIITLLRANTAHDFTLYKHGTLQRRIVRRMGLFGIEATDVERYIGMLKDNSHELLQLAKDLLIHVTSFFRDPKVFEYLAKDVFPEMVRNASDNQPLRIWIAGCSTGEETYSITMLLHEAVAAAKSTVRFQVFASDVDPDAVSAAREGLYPETIEADISAARLAKFFVREGGSYRVQPWFRSAVVFTVQDVLADPPFSRLDFISCRNLLIYLALEAQTKVISLFHFALRPGGFLLLGGSETAGRIEGRFELVSKQERLYRHIGQASGHEQGFLVKANLDLPAKHNPEAPATPRPVILAALCRQILVETYAPAAVLVNAKFECLYLLGPTERYLTFPAGPASLDILAMVAPQIRTRIRSAIQRSAKENARIVLKGGKYSLHGRDVHFKIAVQMLVREEEELFLVCFPDDLSPENAPSITNRTGDNIRIAEVESELEATRAELEGAISNLEISGEEQKAIYEEALSVNQEYQSTNEELLASKEELQSLNEELTALNGQLHETLERQRSTADDLQNVLYSTDVATIFLDTRLHIRFFTPATRSLFNVIASDVGRPLSDLNSQATDSALTTDALEVLKSFLPIEREIESRNGIWFLRRILPYRTHDDRVEGIVITFTDITERKNTATALEAARQRADIASVAKSRFLAAASHDLRQPLQTFALIQGLLAKIVEGPKAQELVARLDQTLGAMTSMLNTLLDINQIEAGTVQAELSQFRISDILDHVEAEFSYQAQAQGVQLRLVSSKVMIESDPRLLEQMLRNLLSNALKYTRTGKVLIGCRRRFGRLSIEVWDTGIGIPEDEFYAIFDEYHQVDNKARERNRGLGLGLSIVRRLGHLLGHRVKVRSQVGKGSVFSIDGISRPATTPLPLQKRPSDAIATPQSNRRLSSVLIVEDDPDVRGLLELLLQEEGHTTATAADGSIALALVESHKFRPDIILADYNLPNGMDGLQLVAKIRSVSYRHIPVIILTGDIKADTMRNVADQDCVQLNKPVNPKDMMQVIQRLLSRPKAIQVTRDVPESPALQIKKAPAIYVVDDDLHVCERLREVLEAEGRRVETFLSSEAFLDSYVQEWGSCLLVDAYLPGMTGMELIARLRKANDPIPAIVITGQSDVAIAVQAMKVGANDFIEKPIGRAALIKSIDEALFSTSGADTRAETSRAAALSLKGLTQRQREIMRMVLAGQPSKNIAADLGISQRTVENHRASIMRKTGSKSLPALARLALAASNEPPDKT